ncbi:hypothetical protein LEP1GSC088_4719 [Leptospira interrogans str. L1207]|nr:hypothetical protein LEP1GSC088_4719 [Leptospira interrogans str. L1207]
MIMSMPGIGMITSLAIKANSISYYAGLVRELTFQDTRFDTEES